LAFENLDIHQRLILYALCCFAVTIVVEYVTKGSVIGEWWWSPLPALYESRILYFMPDTPIIVGVLLLLVALFVKEK